MIIAVIPAYNDEMSIGSLIIKTKEHVDKIIVVNDSSDDDTAKIAKIAGAVVISTDKKSGLSLTNQLGLKKALEYNPEIVINLTADFFSNPDDIPELIRAVKSDGIDVAIGSKKTLFRAYNLKAIKTIVELKRYDNDIFQDIFSKSKLYNLKSRILPPKIQWSPFYKKYEKHTIEWIKTLDTIKKLYTEKRNLQKQVSKTETYKLICETFLKFIPPAVFSLFVSIYLILPATTTISISNNYLVFFFVVVISTFLICLKIMMALTDRLYKDNTTIELIDEQLQMVDKND